MFRSRNRLIADWFASLRYNEATQTIEHEEITTAADEAISTSVVALETEVDGKISSSDVTSVLKLTQAQYDALTPDATTLYVIVG